MVVPEIPLACEVLIAKPEPIFMILIPVLSTHPGWKLAEYRLSCSVDG